MGFFRLAKLVIDAIRHDVEVRPVDINESHWDCHLEPSRGKQPALRLGLLMVKGLSQPSGEQIVTPPSNTKFKTLQDLAQSSDLDQRELGALAAADALAVFSGNRHRAYWEVAGIEELTELLGVA